MIKNLLGGVGVGIANIIPGVSGGTIMVILGLFDQVMASIDNIFKKDNKSKIKDIWFLFQILIGAGIGLVLFAKVIEWLFANYYHETLYWFSGLIIFSIPVIKKRELHDHKSSLEYIIFGMITVLLLVYLSPNKTEEIITAYPIITILYAFKLIIVGTIAGATMLFPGVSGSMVLLLIGEYHYFKSYLANITTFDPVIITALTLIGIGIAIGIISSAKIINYLLKHYRTNTISFILGLLIMSGLSIIPLPDTSWLSVVLAFIFGALVITSINKLNDK